MTDITMPTQEQQDRAKWDLLLLDIEQRSEQIRQMKSYEPKRLWIQATGAAAALLGAGAVMGAFILSALLQITGHR